MTLFLVLITTVWILPAVDDLGSHGSLAVFVPTREGLLVCTDKREWNKVRGATDAEIKIHRLGSSAAFTVTGTVGVLDRTTLRPIFSVGEEVLRHLEAEPNRPVSERIQGLPKALENSYRRFREVRGGRLERSPGGMDDVISLVSG